MTLTLTGATIDTGNQVSVSPTVSNPRGLFFKPDGTKMYVCRRGTPGANNIVYQYTLSTPWDLTTASYSSVSLDTSSVGAGASTGLAFSADGTKMYVPHSNDQTIYQYTLATAWDLSSASYASISKNVNAQVAGAIAALFFKDDGTKMYVLGGADNLYSYTLSTAWNVSTATYDSVSMPGPGTSTGAVFGPDGKVVFLLGIGGTPDIFVERDLPTAWSLISPGGGPTLTSNTDNGGAIAVSDETTKKLFHVDFGTLIVYRWSIGSTVLTGWRIGMVL